MERLRELFGQEVVTKFEEYRQTYSGTEVGPSIEQELMEMFLRKFMLDIFHNSKDFSVTSKFLDSLFEFIGQISFERSLPFLVIEDFIEFGSPVHYAGILKYLEGKSCSWISKLSSKKGNGLILLRSLNSLRRKLVRSENSALSGRALLLLSKIFPLNERSGLNLKGEKNLENATFKAIGTLNEHLSSFKAIYELFYSSSYKIKDAGFCKMLKSSTEFIFAKIEDRLSFESGLNFDLAVTDEGFFSPQHLVSNENFELQIADQGFRLSILTQVLVLLQDLKLQIEQLKTKSDVQIDVDGESVVNELTKGTFHLISMHHCGKEYFRFLRSVLRNENNWIEWKSSACPDYFKEQFGVFSIDVPSAPTCPKLIVLGDSELQRLWNYSYKSVENRKLKPDLESCVSDPIEEGEDCAIDEGLNWRQTRLKWKLSY